MAFTSKKPVAGKAKTTTASKATVKRTPPPKFDFPATNEIKSFHVRLRFRTDIDGFVSPRALQLEAIKGRPGSERAEEYELFSATPRIAATAVSRFMLVTYAANVTKRLPPKKQYEVLLVVTVTKEGLLRCRVKEISTGKGFATLLDDKTDPIVRRLRRCAKFVAPAFQDMPAFEDLQPNDDDE